jgi:hypothetical protein
MNTKRSELSRLLSTHPYVQKVEKQMGEFFANVKPEDREPPVLVGMFDPIPRPVDPYGCENPVNQENDE